MWQEWVFLVGGFFGGAILWPGILDPSSAWPRTSSVPTTLLLGAYTASFYTLGMPLSALGSLFTCFTWGVIAAFKAPDGGGD